MIFNSLTYLLLLSVVVPLYWILSYRTRLLLIFTASLIFYSFWRVEFLPLLLFSTAIDWWIAQSMSNKIERYRFRLLIFSITINLGFLFYFKYLIFFTNNAVGIANLLGAEIDPILLNILLPLGISFYTFQTISYTVDVYRRKIKPEKDFVLYACYVTFFPQLVAGPILRASEILNQFKKRKVFSINYLWEGIRRILYGFFLKVVLADNIAPLVDSGYSMSLETISALDVWTLAFLFGFQIYFDFSAYSHIAIGSAKLIGVTFPENFKFPYSAKSPKDFWRRWHISLSSWIRDYLYLPLLGLKAMGSSSGGINATKLSQKNIRPLFITWIIMGFWHGANWTFLLWGVYHAFIIFIYRIIKRKFWFLSIKSNLISFALTLPILMLGWIPFRAESIDDALFMWSKIFQPTAYTWLGMRENTYIITVLLIISYHLLYLIHEKFIYQIKIMKKSFIAIDIIVITIVTIFVIIFFQPINQFIYFQF